MIAGRVEDRDAGGCGDRFELLVLRLHAIGLVGLLAGNRVAGPEHERRGWAHLLDGGKYLSRRGRLGTALVCRAIITRNDEGKFACWVLGRHQLAGLGQRRERRHLAKSGGRDRYRENEKQTGDEAGLLFHAQSFHELWRWNKKDCIREHTRMNTNHCKLAGGKLVGAGLSLSLE